jgi:cell division protein FtsL
MRTKIVLPLLLSLAIIASGIALVYARHQSRLIYIELQTTRIKEQQATDEWGQLQLELATQSTLEKVLRRATRELNMQKPQEIRSITLKP